MTNGDDTRNELLLLVAGLTVAGAHDDVDRAREIAVHVHETYGVEGVIESCVSLAKTFHKVTGMDRLDPATRGGFFSFQADVVDENDESQDIADYQGGDPFILGSLAAMRWIVALGNGDVQNASAIIQATSEYPFAFLYELARMAGSAWQQHAGDTHEHLDEMIADVLSAAQDERPEPQ